MYYHEEEVVVNPDDIADGYCDTGYAIYLETGTYWLAGPYIVCADNLENAFDIIGEWCADNKPWLIVTEEERQTEYADDEYFDEEHFSVGNADDIYIPDRGNIRIIDIRFK